MKYAIKILKLQQKIEAEQKKNAIRNDSYKGVVDADKNTEEIGEAITALEKIKS